MPVQSEDYASYRRVVRAIAHNSARDCTVAIIWPLESQAEQTPTTPLAHWTWIVFGRKEGERTKEKAKEKARTTKDGAMEKEERIVFRATITTRTTHGGTMAKEARTTPKGKENRGGKDRSKGKGKESKGKGKGEHHKDNVPYSNCKTCGKPGHWSKECWMNKNKVNQVDEGSTSPSTTSTTWPRIGHLVQTGSRLAAGICIWMGI